MLPLSPGRLGVFSSPRTLQHHRGELLSVWEAPRSGADRPAEGEATSAEGVVMGGYFSLSQLSSAARTVGNARG